MKLNTLKADGWNKRKWCGPAALSIITGRTLKFCHNKLAKLEGTLPRYLKGVSNESMLWALREMGFKPIRVDDAYRMTLRAYIEERQSTKHFRGVMLVNVTGHYVVCWRGSVADNGTNGKPVDVRNHPSKRKKIQYAWIIEKA